MIKRVSLLAKSLILLTGVILLPVKVFPAYEYQGDNLYLIPADGILIDTDDTAITEYIIQFGNLVGQTLKWDITNSRFAFSSNVRVQGNFATVGQNFTAADHSASNSDGFLNLGRNSGSWQSLSWNSIAGRFDLSGALKTLGNIDLNSNQLINARLENLSSAPTCNSGVKGLQYFNTTSNAAYTCNGGMFLSSAGKYYNGTAGSSPTQVTDIIVETLSATTAATNTMYLTDNGLVSGNKLFTTVYSVSATASVNNPVASAPFLAGYNYNTSTGLLTLTFLESAGILIGGQGLEAASAGTAYTVTIIGK